MKVSWPIWPTSFAPKFGREGHSIPGECVLDKMQVVSAKIGQLLRLSVAPDLRNQNRSIPQRPFGVETLSQDGR